MKLSIRVKLFAACLGLALAPLAVIGFVTWRTASSLEAATAKELKSVAETIGDKIDRCMFERYGDVQAFAANPVFADREQWGKRDESEPLVKTINKYIELYGIYYLTLVIDADGKLVAVNTRDAKGDAIDTSALYQHDFSREKWFRDVKAGAFTVDRNSTLTGTLIQDVYEDEDVRQIFKDEGLAIGFASQLRNANGEVIGVVKNITRFDVVEEIVHSQYASLKARGIDTANLIMINNKGTLLVDCDPTARGNDNVFRDMSAINKTNLADLGIPCAQGIVAGKSNSITYSRDPRRTTAFCGGYAPNRGALGFGGMPWGVMCRADRNQAFAAQDGLKAAFVWTGVIGSIVISVLSYLLARAIADPIRKTVAVLKDIAEGEGDLTRRLAVTTSDEVGELAKWFNQFVGRIENTVRRIAGNATQLSKVSTELAQTADELSNGAGLSKTQSATVSSAAEEMSINMKNMAASGEQMSGGMRVVAASVEEMTSTIGEIAKNAERSAHVASEAKKLTDISNERISRLGVAADEIGKVIEVIQDIAEQTNLLALNATIEAARAGEAGKGFAVVATEVKELAKQTAAATDDIRARIDAIQKTTTEAVDSIGSISTIIADVNNVSRTIAAAVEEQSITTKEIAKNVSEIAGASEAVARGVNESASASREITQSIGRVDQVLNQTAAAAVQSKSEGENLERISAEMQSLVGSFRFAANGEHSLAS